MTKTPGAKRKHTGEVTEITCRLVLPKSQADQIMRRARAILDLEYNLTMPDFLSKTIIDLVNNHLVTIRRKDEK